MQKQKWNTQHLKEGFVVINYKGDLPRLCMLLTEVGENGKHTPAGDMIYYWIEKGSWKSASSRADFINKVFVPESDILTTEEWNKLSFEEKVYGHAVLVTNKNELQWFSDTVILSGHSIICQGISDSTSTAFRFSPENIWVEVKESNYTLKASDLIREERERQKIGALKAEDKRFFEEMSKIFNKEYGHVEKYDLINKIERDCAERKRKIKEKFAEAGSGYKRPVSVVCPNIGFIPKYIPNIYFDLTDKTPEEIAEYVSDKLIGIVKKSFEKTKTEFVNRPVSCPFEDICKRGQGMPNNDTWVSVPKPSLGTGKKQGIPTTKQKDPLMDSKIQIKVYDDDSILPNNWYVKRTKKNAVVFDKLSSNELKFIIIFFGNSSKAIRDPFIHIGNGWCPRQSIESGESVRISIWKLLKTKFTPEERVGILKECKIGITGSVDESVHIKDTGLLYCSGRWCNSLLFIPFHKVFDLPAPQQTTQEETLVGAVEEPVVYVSSEVLISTNMGLLSNDYKQNLFLIGEFWSVGVSPGTYVNDNTGGNFKYVECDFSDLKQGDLFFAYGFHWIKLVAGGIRWNSSNGSVIVGNVVYENNNPKIKKIVKI